MKTNRHSSTRRSRRADRTEKGWDSTGMVSKKCTLQDGCLHKFCTVVRKRHISSRFCSRLFPRRIRYSRADCRFCLLKRSTADTRWCRFGKCSTFCCSCRCWHILCGLETAWNRWDTGTSSDLRARNQGDSWDSCWHYSGKKSMELSKLNIET